MALNPICLPPGFGFHPTDEELVGYYLKRKVHGHKIEVEVIPEVDLYKCEPWDLPEKSYLPSQDLGWHFFCPRDRKYPNYSRTNRAIQAGYWKATGKDRKVTSVSPSGRRTIGTKKTLVFHRGRAPFGQRSDWIMHEYRLEKRECQKPGLQDAFVLCCVFKKKNTGSGFPTNNAVIDDSSFDRHFHHEGISTGMTPAEIDKWVEILLHEPDDDDQHSNLELPNFSPKEFRCNTNLVDVLERETTPSACPSFMVDKWIPLNAEFPVCPIVHWGQSLETADEASESSTVLEELLTAAKTYQGDNSYDQFDIDGSLTQSNSLLEGDYLEADDILSFSEKLEINKNCSEMEVDYHHVNARFGGILEHRMLHLSR